MFNLKRKDGSPISDGINDTTYKLLFGDVHNLSKEECLSKEYETILNTIELFTMYHHKKIIFKLLKLYNKNNENIKLNNIIFNEKGNCYEYKQEDKNIKFRILAKCFFDKKLIRELNSKKRYHKCHDRAIEIGPSIENSKIVTGYVTIGKSKFLHSFIETESKNNITLVLDWTMNLIIDKEDYIKITNFVELSSFESIKVIEDLPLFKGNITLGSKTYLTFRNEIINEIKSKPCLFKETNEGKEAVRPFLEGRSK